MVYQYIHLIEVGAVALLEFAVAGSTNYYLSQDHDSIGSFSCELTSVY